MASSQPGSATAAGAAAAEAPPELGGWGYDTRHQAGADGAGYVAGQYYAGDAEGGQYGAGSGNYEAAAMLPGTGYAHDGQYTGQYAVQEQQQQEATNPGSQLQLLEQQVQQLTAQRAQVQAELVQAAAAAYQQASSKLGPASTGVALPAELPPLVEELTVLQAARQYLAYLQELQALARLVEKGVRALERAAAEGDTAALLQSASEATDSFSHAMGYVNALQQLAADGRMPAELLKQYGAGLGTRVDAAQSQLRGLLRQAIQQRLEAASWPPPLAASSGDAGGAGDDVAGISTWAGWAAGPGGEAVLAELQQLFVALLTMQRVVQQAEFAALAESPAGEGPVLWVAEELAAPLAARLRHHFAEGLPTDRADKPEWLFATALRTARQLAPHAQAFQPAVEAHQLEGWYSMPLEMARAMQTAAVAPVLTSHVLPRLAAAADPALWLHYADEAMSFERSFAPLRGSTAALPDEEDFLSAAHPNSAIEVLFSSPAWEQGWLEAEHWDAARQLEAACEAYSAWQPAVLALAGLAGAADDLLAETPRAGSSSGTGSRSTTASQNEFWPPACAEQLASLVGGLVRRGGWLSSRQRRLAFMRAVPLAVLRSFRERLSTQLQTGEQFREMLGEVWLPKMGAAICAAHYMEHQLREPQGVLLLAELQDAEPGSAAAAAGEASGKPATAGLAGLLEREASAFASLRKQWAYKLAKAAADAFHALFAPYKRDLAAFSAGHEEESAAGFAAPPLPSPSISSIMLAAADGLQQLLRALAQHLDAVVLRDVWRSVALAVNYSLYNDIATEALFSQQGALQLDTDANAVVAVFGELTSRPAAHFKETREACRLLTLPLAQALELLAVLSSARSRGTEGAQAARAALLGVGVKVLTAEQAACVLGQRLDVITASTTHAAGTATA